MNEKLRRWETPWLCAAMLEADAGGERKVGDGDRDGLEFWFGQSQFYRGHAKEQTNCDGGPICIETILVIG